MNIATLIHQVIRQFGLVLLVLTLAAPIEAQGNSRRPELNAPSHRAEAMDPNATTALTWSMPKRYDRSWKAWDENLAEYVKEFINPTDWPVKLDACASSAGSPINRYEFLIVGYERTLGVDVPFYKRTFDGPECQVDARVPRLGPYTVELKIHTDLGVSEPRRERINVQDYLVASIGDSFASGEGNPDKPGEYELEWDYIYAFWKEIVDAKPIRPAEWKDVRCHRTAKSGHAKLAEALEDQDPHSSVTFLSFACSGADLKHLINTQYSGRVDKPGPVKLLPQIDALERAVGQQAYRGGRRVDILLIAAGINDLKFSDVLKKCAENVGGDPGDCVTDEMDDSGFKIQDGLDYLEGPAGYESLGRRLRGSTLALGDTYLIAYPSKVFINGGCGVLGQIWAGISDGDGAVMADWGDRLNLAIERATEKFNWNYLRIPQNVVDLFGSHPYSCYSWDDSWFVLNEESWRLQGDENGTAHPNAEGHRAVANLLLANVFPGQDYFAPYKHVKVIVDRISYSSALNGRGGTGSIVVSAYKYDRDEPGKNILTSSFMRIPRLNGSMPTNLTTELDMYLNAAHVPPRLQRSRLNFQVFVSISETNSGPFGVPLSIPSLAIWDVTHTRDELFGFGSSHTLRRGRISVTYHVEVIDPKPPPGPCRPNEQLCIPCPLTDPGCAEQQGIGAISSREVRLMRSMAADWN